MNTKFDSNASLPLLYLNFQLPDHNLKTTSKALCLCNTELPVWVTLIIVSKSF